NIDVSAKRISLGMKQLQKNPWDVVLQNYPVGSIIEGKIKNITDFGIFIGIEEGIDGLIHVSDISWTERIKHPSEKYSKGEIIQAVVLNIDRDNERFSLGIKQLTPNPWEEVVHKYPVGSVIEGLVTNITDFGIFVEIEDGIEGLVHISEISEEKTETPVGLYNVGDRITTKVISLSPEDRKIGLSIKALIEKSSSEKASSAENYNSKQEDTGPATLGDLIKEEFNNQEKGGE
ncbi:MAG: S1 RNA-binding domain-containing protein, partial [Thermodesulfobacteriota bacterium]